MNRRFPVPDDDALDAGQQRVADQLLTAARGSRAGPYAMLVRSPAMTERLRPLISYFARDSALPKRLSELAILIQAQLWSQDYEWWAHEQIAREAGLACGLVAALHAGLRPRDMAADETAVFEFCRALQPGAAVTDGQLAAIRQHLDDRQIVELVTLSGVYATLAMLLNLNQEAAPPDAPRPRPGA